MRTAHLPARVVTFSILAAASLRAASPANFESAPSAEQIAFFEKSFRPVLVDKCYKCHSAEAEKVKGGLLLDTREGIRAGGDSGHAVVPGSLTESLLIEALHSTDKDKAMPPEKSGGKLPDEVIRNFEKWVMMGAPDPRDGATKVVSKKEIDWAKARDFWAFKKPQSAAVPQPLPGDWPRSDLDPFILTALEAKNLKPVVDADPRALIRRITFDLTGLPPTPEEVEAFAKSAIADRQSAIEALVDRLLASPQFGERWGRHWLDVARFAESTGKERNFTFPEAWRYRDWVIAAVNADKPYDQFIVEQIAGDLLPAADAAERDAHLVATGFLALGPKGLNEKNREQFRMDLVDDQIDATSRAVLGLTVACARCHDHKFDPIPTRDYYALAGIFRSTDTCFGTAGGRQNKNGTDLLALSSAETFAPAPVAKEVTPTAPAATAEARLAAFLAANPDKAKRFASLPPAKKERLMARFVQEGVLPTAGGKAAGGKKGARYAAAPAPTASGVPQAMGVREGRAGDSPIFIRGEVDHRGETVPRGVVTVLTEGAPPSMPATSSGRLELARWLTASENPLTARVMVNRVWLHLFGQGLVTTPDNFGATGTTPSHPALLDHLALQFMRDGWSVKKLVRSIVLSRAYQLSSAHDSTNFAADPDNVLLWRASPRRLDAEAIRDAILAASGQLDLAPLDGSVVAKVGDGYIGKGIRPAAFKTDSNKRSVYLPIVRDFVPEVLEVFDFAEPSLVVGARDVTNVPAQALYLMNDPFVLAQAAAMAKRILAAPFGDPQRIELAYQLTLSRPPSDTERARADEFLRTAQTGVIPVKNASASDASVTAWATFCQALFACAEFRYLKYP
jgi:hypothetical protein